MSDLTLRVTGTFPALEGEDGRVVVPSKTVTATLEVEEDPEERCVRGSHPAVAVRVQDDERLSRGLALLFLASDHLLSSVRLTFEDGTVLKVTPGT